MKNKDTQRQTMTNKGKQRRTQATKRQTKTHKDKQ